MARNNKPPFHSIDEDSSLRMILEGTSGETGIRFFAVLVEHLVGALGVYGAWVTEYLEAPFRLRSLAMFMGGKRIDHYEYDISGTPCEPVVEHKQLIHIPDRVINLYPRDPDLADVGAVSYMGLPLLDLNGDLLGHLAVLDNRPMPEEPRTLTVFRIFADRAAAEMRRLRAEADIVEREEKLRRLVASALDAIIELDADFRVTMMNPAAEKLFGCSAANVAGRKFDPFLDADVRETIRRVARDLDARAPGEQYEWIAAPFVAVRAGGDTFPAEGTLSRSELHQRSFYTLILRNVNERVRAAKKIRALTAETNLLKEELRSLGQFDDMVGESAGIRAVREAVDQVAGTDATVLVTGETGTGKELVARALHERSRRAKRPLVKVNCAAIPSTLIESEFFGHEKGAFTGATQKREGRFALADGGTIFLDEVGELPLELQGKLLRVLQEGEFDPVGSSRTQKVDVRVVAATNRVLESEVKEGRFREDLFHRLNVFPITVPPLRDRGDDIVTLANVFAERIAGRMGRVVDALDSKAVMSLLAYAWPGNVRELQNVIERALIVSTGSRLAIERAFPVAALTPLSPSAPVPAVSPPHVRTARELQALERENIVRALEATGWRVSGKDGAAALLVMNPSTLSSRMRTLRIKRPA